MICVSDSVSEKRRCFVCSYTFLIVKMFYSCESCFTLSDLPFYSFPSVGVNRSDEKTLLKLCCCVFYSIVQWGDLLNMDTWEIDENESGLSLLLLRNGFVFPSEKKKLPEPCIHFAACDIPTSTMKSRPVITRLLSWNTPQREICTHVCTWMFGWLWVGLLVVENQSYFHKMRFLNMTFTDVFKRYIQVTKCIDFHVGFMLFQECMT